MALAPFSSNLILPSMLSMTTALDTDYGGVQLAISIFVLGLGVGQLILGPLSDRYGRRPVLILSLSTYLVASVACAYASGIEELLLWRAVQSIGACAGMVVGRAIIRDCFDRDAAARAYAYVGTGLAIGPLLAPIVGGQMETWAGWQANFLLLTALGALATLMVWRLLPETNAHLGATQLRPGQMARTYAGLFGSRSYTGYVLAVTFSYGGIFAFASGAASILIGQLGVTPETFGLVYALAVGSYGAGTLTASQLSGRLGIDRMILIAALVAVAATATFLALALTDQVTMWRIVIAVMIYTYATGWIFPNGQTGAISPYPDRAGAAAALLGSTQMIVAAGIGALVGQLDDGTPLPTAAVMATCALGILTVFYFMVWRGRSDRKPI